MKPKSKTESREDKERAATAAERLERNAKRVAKFRAAYAAHGIAVSDETLMQMAQQEPMDVQARSEREKDGD